MISFIQCDATKIHHILIKWIFPLIVILLFWVNNSWSQSGKSNLTYVDPTIGGVGLILEPVRPTIHLPNSMVRVHPVRADQLDDQISYFPLTVVSHRIYKVFGLLPFSGKINTSPWSRKAVYDNEILSPYYYAGDLTDDSIRVEFTPGEKTGTFRFDFQNAQERFVRLETLNAGGRMFITGKRELSGMETFSGMSAYFYGEFSEDVHPYMRDSTVRTDKLVLQVLKRNQLYFKYGVSFISIEQAKENLRREMPSWSFEKVKQNAYKKWDSVLNKINVTGGTLQQKRTFYTALYRCYERMVDINEYGKYYSAYDKKVHESNEPFFVDNWIWDTYIALEPLHMILNPRAEAYKIKSYIKMWEQSGWMPSFALIFGDWPAMTGNYAACWMADAWFKGIRDFNLESAYKGLRKNSLDATLLPWNNGPPTILDSFYNRKGYMPALWPGEPETVKEVKSEWEKRQAVSVTLENSYSDWCISKLAGVLKKETDSIIFLKRSLGYQKVFRADRGFMWPKDSSGQWIEPYDPRYAGREYFTENNAYTYNWHVKHDFKGLFDLMGGLKGAEAKLDSLFRENLGIPKFRFWHTQPDASGLVGQFVMGNEPGFHIPYLYNHTGSPWKTQKRIRSLLNTWFSDNLFGIPGDEDGGGMSAFIVFSMLGFFQVTPGVPVYDIGSPVFTKASIELPNGKTFKVIANNNSPVNKYILKASLNGKALNKPSFGHADLMDGGVLELHMGSSPNRDWGKTY
jgi:predicted alpha-1,2-mannosidase